MRSKVLLMASLAMLGASQLKAQLNVGSASAPASMLYVNGPIAQPETAITASGTAAASFSVAPLTGIAFVRITGSPTGAFSIGTTGTPIGGQRLTIINAATTYAGTFAGISIATGSTVSFIYSAAAAAWLATSPAVANLYNADGTLSGARTVAQGANTLTFSGTGTVSKLSGAAGSAAQFTLGRTTFESDMGVASIAAQAFAGTVAGDGWVRSLTGNMHIGTYAANDMVFYSSNAERMRLTAAGNMGIGTVAPVSKLDVTGALGFNGAIANGLLRSNTAGILNLLVGSTSLNIDNNAGATNLMAILNTGNVGIGTGSSPNQKLTIGSGSGSTTSPTVILMDNSYSSIAGQKPKIILFGDTTSNGSFGLGVSAGQLNYIAPTTNDHVFYNNNIENMRLAANGSFKLAKYGVGTFTGVAVNYLAVDATGKIIEQTLNSGTAPNIYNVDGAISSARTVDMNTYTLGFKGTAGTFTFNNTGNTFSTSASSLGLTQLNDAYGPTSLLLQNRYGLNGMLVTSGNAITGAPGFVAVTDVALQTQGGGTLNVKAKQVNLRAESRTGGIFGNYNNSIDTTELQLGKAGAPALVVGDNYVVSRTYFGIAMGANDSVRTLLSIAPKATGAKITLFDGGNLTAHFGFGVSSSQLNYDAPTGTAHVFYLGGKNGTGTEMMRIQGTGTTLDVKGAVGFNGSALNGLLRSNAGGIFNIISGSVGINFDNNAGSANLMSLTNAGALNVVGNISAGSYSTNSDRRLKTNIVSIKGALDKVMTLVPYSYDKKASIASTKYDHKEMGFIAQDIKKIFPELIVEGTDADKTLSVNYIALIPLLTKAIQEQQAQNNAQVAQIANLKKENLAIAAQLAEVKEMKTAMAEMRKELNKMAVIKIAGSNTASK